MPIIKSALGKTKAPLADAAPPLPALVMDAADAAEAAAGGDITNASAGMDVTSGGVLSISASDSGGVGGGSTGHDDKRSRKQ